MTVCRVGGTQGTGVSRFGVPCPPAGLGHTCGLDQGVAIAGVCPHKDCALILPCRTERKQGHTQTGSSGHRCLEKAPALPAGGTHRSPVAGPPGPENVAPWRVLGESSFHPRGGGMLAPRTHSTLACSWDTVHQPGQLNLRML